MSGLGRITQAIPEALGPISAHGRITQLYAEALGPITSSSTHGRITQLTAETLGAIADHARVTQLTGEALGPFTSHTGTARITQLYAEALGIEIITGPCRLPADFRFYGDVSGLFYRMESLGAESVPIPLTENYVNIGYANSLDIAQHLTVEETWTDWFPLNGGLQVKFSSGNPVRTVWVVTNLARATPPSIQIWASAQRFDLWKQECNP